MVRANNRRRGVAVPRAVLREAAGAEILAALGATASEIESARQALREARQGAPDIQPLTTTVQGKE